MVNIKHVFQYYTICVVLKMTGSLNNKRLYHNYDEEEENQEDIPLQHIWDLPVLHFHEIMVIYPYLFFGGNYPIVLLDNIY